jgi:ribose-phosphate pyrophosphokinase
VKAAGELKRFGAKRVFAFASHGLFNGRAIELIKNSELEKVVVTDTIPLAPEKQIDKIVVLSVSHLLADSIRY